MAIAKSGLLRGLKGKTAGLVMSQTKQGTVVREYKSSITNPKTPAQQANRAVFKAAVSNSSNSLSQISQMYGTNKMPSYSKLVSMLMKNIGGKASRSFRDGIHAPVPPMFNEIGVNNEGLSLNVLDLRYAELVKHSSETTSSNKWADLLLGYNLPRPSDETLDLYFGCDYALDTVKFCALSLTSAIFHNIDIEFVSMGSDLSGDKNMGSYSSAVECGTGWRYIYKTTLRNSNYHACLHIALHESDGATSFFKDDIYISYESTSSDFAYCTALICSGTKEAFATKQGGLFLSSGNFASKMQWATPSNS